MFVIISRRKILVIINGELRLWFPGSITMVVLGGKTYVVGVAYWERVIHVVSGHGVLGVGIA